MRIESLVDSHSGTTNGFAIAIAAILVLVALATALFAS